MPDFSNKLPVRFVMSNATSFSFVPNFPIAPGSLPPWPASNTTVSKRHLAFTSSTNLSLLAIGVRKVIIISLVSKL